MRIVLVTPAGPKTRTGNRNTAVRWAGMLRELGHQSTVTTSWDGKAADLMIALHARRSHDSIRRFHQTYPERPLVVILTGTDLYRDIRHDAAAQESMQLATLLVTLQDQGPLELSPTLRPKTRVIYQSAPEAAYAAKHQPAKRHFTVCVVGHLREEKDPFRCAYALPYLPADSRIRVLHLGQAMDQDHAREAARLAKADARYRWLGEVPHWRVRRIMQGSHLMVISSRMEGGANVVSEALAVGLPVLASRVSGNVGMLGKDYAGFYPCCDEKALAALLERAETDDAFYWRLQKQCAARRKLVMPERERKTLVAIVKEAARLARP
jgi:putative glycosyltransferase (TIGR04348 family)